MSLRSREDAVVHGWQGDTRVDRLPGQAESLSSHPGDGDPSRRTSLLAAVCVVVLAIAASTMVMRNRNPDWPTRCGVDGHANWCAKPSRVVTTAALTRLAHDYCPALASVPGGVVPRPLSLGDLAGADVFARTTGSRGSGAEDVLLGRGNSFSWVTRSSGGAHDGAVELRCPGQTFLVPSMRLTDEQYRSTVAAARGQLGRIDFAELAKSSVRRFPSRFRTSYGFLSCDTSGLELRRLSPGKRFTCRVEVYSWLGQGGYRLDYRVLPDPPYFVRDEGQ
jgi:hypothetical protein